MLRTFSAMLIAVFVWPGQAAAQSEAPIDTAQALALLRESAEHLEASDSLRWNRQFRNHLDYLIETWGGDWSLPPLPEEPVDTAPAELTDSLSRIGEYDRALQLIREHGGEGRPGDLVRILYRMAEDGQVDRVLTLADSIAAVKSGIGAILNTAEPPEWDSRIDLLVSYLRTTPQEPAVADANWTYLVGKVAETDLNRALDLARREPAILSPQFRLLRTAAEQRHALTDSLVVDTYERVMRGPDATRRIRQMEEFQGICAEYALEACAGLAIPDNVADLHPLRIGNRLHGALNAGRLLETLAIDDTLRELLTPEEYALTVSRVLDRAIKRGPAYDSATAIILPRLDSIASRSPGRPADQVNAILAGLWAVPEPERAWEAVARIDGDTLRRAALTALAGASYPTDAPMAYEAVRRGGGGIPLRSLWVQSRLYGDTTRAEEVFGMMDGPDRMLARLRWAESIRVSGRWSEAYRLAFEALEEWDPAAEPRPLLLGGFYLFARLGVYDELVAWARGRATPDARASALASVVGGILMYRPPREPIS